MQYRKLGRTGLDVCAIGLGTEYLNGQAREAVVTVVREAIDRGVNYLDLVFSFPEYLENLGAALRGHRERVFLTAHLGSTVKDGQYCKTRSVKRCERCFLDLLASLGTDHVDVLFLHNCNSQSCVYCNHCLPCPSAIDVGQVVRFLEMAQQRLTAELRDAYAALPARASDCIECSACTERCPFGVEVISKMRLATELFES